MPPAGNESSFSSRHCTDNARSAIPTVEMLETKLYHYKTGTIALTLHFAKQRDLGEQVNIVHRPPRGGTVIRARTPLGTPELPGGAQGRGGEGVLVMNEGGRALGLPKEASPPSALPLLRTL